MSKHTIREDIIHAVRDLDTMPTLPAVVERLKQEIESPKASARSVATLVEDDPPTMARVLKLVNSPVYAPSFGLGKNITIDQAVVRLGMNELRNIVITSSVMTLFPRTGAANFNRNEFWRHSICCGLVAAALLDYTKVKMPCTRSEIELAGLCHDIGKILLDQYFHDAFLDALDHAAKEKVL
ncbi:MAG: HDOD domain-containing protein, partial [Planctomycetes bacterium]|nr:HDOD domain-containing protein [Planctomycetota bacterium]